MFIWWSAKNKWKMIINFNSLKLFTCKSESLVFGLLVNFFQHQKIDNPAFYRGRHNCHKNSVKIQEKCKLMRFQVRWYDIYLISWFSSRHCGCQVSQPVSADTAESGDDQSHTHQHHAAQPHYHHWGDLQTWPAHWWIVMFKQESRFCANTISFGGIFTSTWATSQLWQREFLQHLSSNR